MNLMLDFKTLFFSVAGVYMLILENKCLWHVIVLAIDLMKEQNLYFLERPITIAASTKATHLRKLHVSVREVHQKCV